MITGDGEVLVLSLRICRRGEWILTSIYMSSKMRSMATEIEVIEAPAKLCCPVKVIAPDDEGIGEAAAVFKALSDETRLRILKTISHMGTLCECNLVPEFGLTQPTISYHLKERREAGLIRSERRGQWVYHQLNAKAMLAAVRRLSEIAG